jgi:hypothetical protein
MGGPLGAQQAITLTPGERIRVWTAQFSGLIGSVSRVTTDSVVLQPENRVVAPLSIPFATVTRLDISRGRRSMGKGALRGARWGALLAVPCAISAGLQHQTLGPNGASVPEAAALGAVSCAFFGGLIGVVVGASNPGEAWERLR